MSGIQMMVMNNVALATVTVPAPILYLDAVDYTGSGTTWPAETGSNGTLVNAPTFEAPAPTYFSFNGTDESATTANLKASFTSNNSQTLEIWVKTASDNGVVISQQGNTPVNSGYHLSVMEIVAGNLKVGLWQAGIGNVTVGAVTRNEWQQYVLTYNDATNTLTGYINAGTPASTTLENDPAAPQWYYALCQADPTSMGDGSFLAADIGLFRVWNSALSAAQIQELYNENVSRFSNSVVTSNLIAYYDPNLVAGYTGTGTTLNDLSDNGLNGTMSNITWTDPYFVYNGTSSQVSIADNALLEPGAGSWTMEAWVNQTASGNDVVLGKFDPGGLTVDVSYSIRTTGTSYYAQIGSGSGSGSTLFVNSTTFVGTLDTWYQLVYVFTNGGTQTLQTFVNGSSIGTVSHNLASILNTATNLYIGSYNGGEFPQWFDGRVGIVRLYNAALSSADVLQNYNANRTIYGL
jgi:hypothetical protein